MAPKNKELLNILKNNKDDMLDLWKKQLLTKAKQVVELMGLEKMKTRTQELMENLITAIPTSDDITSENYIETLTMLKEFSKEMTLKNLTPTETAMFILSIKDAFFPVIQEELGEKDFAKTLLAINVVIDKLGLYTFEEYLKVKEEIITAQ